MKTRTPNPKKKPVAKKTAAAPAKKTAARPPSQQGKPRPITVHVIRAEDHGTLHRKYEATSLPDFFATEDGRAILDAHAKSMPEEDVRRLFARIDRKPPGNPDTVAAYKEPAAPFKTSRSALELAWGIIANAGGGNWDNESKDWQNAAAAWRDRYFASGLDAPNPPPGLPMGFRIGGREIRVIPSPDVLRHDNPRFAQYDHVRGVIGVQTPTPHYQPTPQHVEQVLYVEIIRAQFVNANRPDLSNDETLLQTLAAFAIQRRDTSYGSLDLSDLTGED